MQDELLKFLCLPRTRYLRWKELETEHDLLLARLTGIVAPTDAIHVGGTKDVHQDAGAIKLTELSDAVLRARLDYIRVLGVVDRFLDGLSNSTSRSILRYRYLNHLTWTEVAARLNEIGVFYSDRHLTRLHEQAIREARKLYYDPEGGFA